MAIIKITFYLLLISPPFTIKPLESINTYTPPDFIIILLYFSLVNENRITLI